MKNTGSKHRPILFYGLFAVAFSLFYCWPIFKDMGNLGGGDWDQFFFYHIVPRDTFLKFFEFPFWNPFYCGGHVHLANPQSRFLSPLFLIHLLLGPVFALKWEILVHLIIGFMGMIFLGKDIIKIKNPWMILLSSLLFTYSGFHAAHFHIGHMTFLTNMYAPWVLYFYLKNFNHHQYQNSFWGGVFLALMVLEGGIFAVPFSVLFLLGFSLYHLFASGSLLGFRNMFWMGLSGIGLSSPKLIPMLIFLQSNPRKVEGRDVLQLSDLLSTLFETDTQVLSQLKWGFHENSAYMSYLFIGILLLLVLGGLFYKKGRYFFFLGFGFFFLSYAMGNFSSFSPYGIFHKLPFFSQLHIPFRSIPYAFLAFNLALMYGLKKEETLLRFKWSQYAIGILLFSQFFVVANFAQGLFKKSFPYPEKIALERVTKKIKRSEFSHILKGPRYFSGHAQYPIYLANRGTLECYEALPIKRAPDSQLMKTPLVQVKKGRVENIRFSPNQVEFDLIDAEGTVSLNQNYSPGWYGGPLERETDIKLGTPAFELKKKTTQKNIRFFFYAPGFNLGLFLLILSIGLYFFFKWIDYESLRKLKKTT